VLNSSGEPISNSIVTIDNTSIVPEIHMQTLTDNTGQVILPGSPVCINCYKIKVTKSGYSIDQTFGVDQVANPLLPHASILEGQRTNITFAIDQTSTLVVKSYGSRNSGFPPISNVIFTIKGTKIIGYDTADNPVYKFSFSTNTGGGIVTIPNLEWDTYLLDFSNSFHNLAGSNPLVPLALAPGINTTVNISAVPKTNDSLLIVAQNPANELLASASAYLFNLSAGFEATKSTGLTGNIDFGQVFFGGLSDGLYDLKINLPGFQEATASLSIGGNTKEIFTLNYVE
jgi:hypothetical protein